MRASSTATGTNGAGSRASILNLPLAPSLPEFLVPDPAVPSVESLLSLSEYSSQDKHEEDPTKPGYRPKPSLLRRSRQVRRAHFSYTTPLPVAFPYAIRPDQFKPKRRKVRGEAVGDGAAVKDGAVEHAAQEAKQEQEQQRAQAPQFDVEDFLATLEPDLDVPIKAAGTDKAVAYSSESRRELAGTPRLVGLSKESLKDLLPNLDVGDAEQYLRTCKDAGGVETQKRQELTEVLAGHAVILRSPEGAQDKGFGPWSLCYGGHQFGSWASQLGDGRAISIFTTPSSWPQYYTTPTYYPPVAELQLKGAGRTPYSRFADGLAVLRSSVREYLGSEAMAALKIPTSRALSLVNLPDVEVQRERMETAAIVCRVAPSWLRIGNFELQWSRDDWDALQQLTSYAGHEVFGFGKQGVKLVDEPEDRSLAAKVLRETSRRTAKLIAGWQSQGWCHGVMNTDNISIAGLTIDYGPYAWMDIYNSNHICNHSDSEGRYSYRSQPPMGIYAIRKLGDALAEMIGAELEMAEIDTAGAVQVQAGWADDTGKLEGWKDAGLAVVDDIATEFTAVFMQEYKRLMARRLGFFDAQQSDFREIFDPLLQLMQEHHLDFSRTFRLLTQFTSTSSPHFERFLDLLLPKDQVPKYLHDACRADWKAWLEKYEKRLESSEAQAGAKAEDRTARMKAANPRFILRQWILEEAISRLEKDNDVAFLQRVLDMATHPFEDYGEDSVDPSVCPEPSEELLEQRRLCEIGDQQMLGFQCSCSS